MRSVNELFRFGKQCWIDCRAGGCGVLFHLLRP